MADLSPRLKAIIDALRLRRGMRGGHPEAGVRTRRRIAAALVPGGKLVIDGGDPLREVDLSSDCGA